MEPSRITFGEFLEHRWLPHVETRTTLKPTTRAHYKRMAQHLIRGVGGIRLNVLQGDDLDRLYDRLAAKGSGDSLRRSVHTVAHKSLGDAIRWRLVGFNAADDATAPAQSRPDPRSWSRDEVSRFLEVASCDRWAPLWRVAATTGMRRGEIVGLRWSGIDLTGSSLIVSENATVVNHAVEIGSPKGGRSRALSLDPGTVWTLCVVGRRCRPLSLNPPSDLLGDRWWCVLAMRCRAVGPVHVGAS